MFFIPYVSDKISQFSRVTRDRVRRIKDIRVNRDLIHINYKF